MSAAIDTAGSHTSDHLPPFALRELSILGGGLLVLWTARLGAVSAVGDELYMVPAGRRLSWSYADQGPLVPLQAYLSDLVAPGSAVVLRLPVVCRRLRRWCSRR